ncbi:mxaD protein [Methyloligella halotolerans]|uniref:MxaD protein n=1 Tax=Methyloligella halotolerans TaxID=1177755 RepID=A0A1E2RX72_9HYPH|nr:SRPBCC family protein [Methyloligella halotolerans]ODA66659.1 mxaD protein [Methyloligella halotolerans]
MLVRNLVLGAAALLLMSVSPALAHGPTPKKAEQTIVIDAPPEKVWAIAKEFGGMADWHPMVETVETADGTRTVTLKDGGKLVDSLDDSSDEEMSYSYRLDTPDIEHFPVSFYSATLDVNPADGGSEVSWIGRFYRADTGNFPSESQNDEAAIAAMDEFLKTGLEGLKAKVEGGE